MLQSVEMISVTYLDGMQLPIRFRIELNDELVSVKIANPVFLEEIRQSGNRMRTFKVNMIANGIMKPSKIFYEVDTCRWLVDNGIQSKI